MLYFCTHQISKYINASHLFNVFMNLQNRLQKVFIESNSFTEFTKLKELKLVAAGGKQSLQFNQQFKTSSLLTFEILFYLCSDCLLRQSIKPSEGRPAEELKLEEACRVQRTGARTDGGTKHKESQKGAFVISLVQLANQKSEKIVKELKEKLEQLETKIKEEEKVSKKYTKKKHKAHKG